MNPARIRRVVIAADPTKSLPLPDTGLPITWDPSPACEPGTLIIHGPRSKPPRGPCRSIMVHHLSLLPYLARQAALYGWDAVAGDPEVYVWKAALQALEEAGSYEPPWPGRLAPPRRPPPLHVWADVYVRRGPEQALDSALRALSAGAHAVVLGGLPGGDPQAYKMALRLVSREAPVLADPAGLIDAEDAYAHGADGFMSLTRPGLPGVPEHLRGEMVFVLVPTLLGSPEERALELLRAEEEAAGIGYRKLVLDPVLQPAVRPGALAGFVAALVLSERARSPLMLGLNNVYEMIDADTTGTIPLLASLAAEAGASVILSSEESTKARGAVLEARLAADLASLALHLGTPPKDYPVRLLQAKEKRPSPW